MVPEVVSWATLLKHVVLPALAPASVIGLYFTPVMLFGCVNRGLMALGVVLVSAVGALVTTRSAVRLRPDDPARAWWLLSSLLLVLPGALLFGPLG